jgi:hypothetical protein
MAFAIDPDEQATLINLRYALADALELCDQLSSKRSETAAILQILKCANIQVMLLLKSQKTEFALERSSAA